MEINVVKEFSPFTGGRTIEEGDYSGELFRNQLLSVRYQEALDNGEKLRIDFDGSYGYSPSFLEESFGGLVRERKEYGIFEHLILVSNDSATLVDDVKRYITEAEAELGKR